MVCWHYGKNNTVLLMEEMKKAPLSDWNQKQNNEGL